MQLSDITTLGRPIDPAYLTNRAIVLLSAGMVAAGAVYQLLRGATLPDSALWGIGAGLALFLAWALARELDPDHDLSAFVAAALALGGLLIFGQPRLLPLFWALLALRVVNRTVGLPAGPLDSLAVLALGGWLVWQGNWVAGLMTAVAFLLDGWLAPPLRHHRLLAGLAFLLTFALAVFRGDLAMEQGPSTATIVIVAAMAGLFLIVIAGSREVRSVGDETGEPLNPRRVQAAQAVALVTALLGAWWQGRAGAVAWSPLWAAMVGAALYRLGLAVIGARRR